MSIDQNAFSILQFEAKKTFGTISCSLIVVLAQGVNSLAFHFIFVEVVEIFTFFTFCLLFIFLVAIFVLVGQ